jgi:hypothetical protein
VPDRQLGPDGQAKTLEETPFRGTIKEERILTLPPEADVILVLYEADLFADVAFEFIDVYEVVH